MQYEIGRFFGRGSWVERRPGLVVAFYRIALGLMWINMALQKAPWVMGPEGKPYGWLYGYVLKEVNNPTFQSYRAFLEGVFLPNFAFFGLFTFIAEIIIGLSLLAGILAPLVGGLGGLLWQINIAVGSYSLPGEWFWLWPLLIGSHAVLISEKAGRLLGIDQLLATHFVDRSPARGTLAKVLRIIA